MRCHLAYNAIQRESLTAVAVARRNGNFPSLVGATCVECDRPAKIFDHRSYLRPLDVQPVCVYHNYHRGSTEEWNPGAIEHIVLEAA